MAVAGTSDTCGWRWPTGAVHGLVVVSLPIDDGWKDCADTVPSVDGSASATSDYELIMKTSKWHPRAMRGSDIRICLGRPLFRR